MSKHRIEEEVKYFNEDGTNEDADLEVRVIARRVSMEEMKRQQALDIANLAEKNNGQYLLIGNHSYSEPKMMGYLIFGINSPIIIYLLTFLLLRLKTDLQNLKCGKPEDYSTYLEDL